MPPDAYVTALVTYDILRCDTPGITLLSSETA